MDLPKNGAPPPPSANLSPSRHSLRLLYNGYYLCDEDSFCWDDLGNVSFSPTQCTVSYKENVVRIFRKRRRTLAQRRLDLTTPGHHQDRRPDDYEAIYDIEPLVVEEICPSSSELCDSGNGLTLQDLADTDHVSSEYPLLLKSGNTLDYCPEKNLMISPHTSKYAKMVEPEHNPSNPVLPGTPQNKGGAESMEIIGHITYVGEKVSEDHQPGRCSCGGYMLVHRDASTCRRFCYDISSCGPRERQHIRERPSDLTPSMPGRVSANAGDTRRMRIIHAAFICVPLLFLCLIFWWLRSPDYDNV
ncbi:transmembrane protein 71 isoform X2 [Dendropsophus ebraccatus]